MYRSERPDRGTIVYVGGLDPKVQKEELEAEFEKFGKLTRVWVAFNPPGFAFVEFIEKADAETAVSSLHDTVMFGNKLRVEISRGRGRGGRGGGGRGSFRGRGAGSDFSSFGGFRGGHGDYRGGRGGDFGRGRGISRGGRGSFGGGFPYDQDEPIKPFRGGGIGGRFNDYERPRSDFGTSKVFGDRGFDDDFGRDFRSVDGPRGFGLGSRDFAPRGDSGRDYPPRNIPDRDYGMSRGPRDFGEYGADRPMNGGPRGFGGGADVDPLDRGYGGRDMGLVRDAPARDMGVVRNFDRVELGGRNYGGGTLDVGMRRDEIRDFNPPRDLAAARDFAGRPSRLDYADDRFGAGPRGGYGDGMAADYDGGYGGFGGARDRFRSRSPIAARASRPMY